MDVSGLSNVWYTAVMNNLDDFFDVVILVRRFGVSTCGIGDIGIGGSTNVDVDNTFFFTEGYYSNSSGMLCQHLSSEE